MLQASTNKSSKKVPLFFYTLYIEGEGSGSAGEGEAIVRVNILDINDNSPVFENASSEIIASVPTTAEYGHPVTKIQVKLLLFLRLHQILQVQQPFWGWHKNFKAAFHYQI